MCFCLIFFLQGLLAFFKRLMGASKKPNVRILLLGLDNAGKTTIAMGLCNENITDVSTTLGFNIKAVKADGVNLNLWDVGG